MDKQTEIMVLASQAMCQQCAADGNVEGCTDTECPTYPIRNGVLPPRKTGRWVATVLRSRCLECCGSQVREVACCDVIPCPLWPWRDGTGIPATPGSTNDVEAMLFEPDPKESNVGKGGKRGKRRVAYGTTDTDDVDNVDDPDDPVVTLDKDVEDIFTKE